MFDSLLCLSHNFDFRKVLTKHIYESGALSCGDGAISNKRPLIKNGEISTVLPTLADNVHYDSFLLKHVNGFT